MTTKKRWVVGFSKNIRWSVAKANRISILKPLHYMHRHVIIKIAWKSPKYPYKKRLCINLSIKIQDLIWRIMTCKRRHSIRMSNLTLMMRTQINIIRKCNNPFSQKHNPTLEQQIFVEDAVSVWSTVENPPNNEHTYSKWFES